jgi:hypothetical protein
MEQFDTDRDVEALARFDQPTAESTPARLAIHQRLDTELLREPAELVRVDHRQEHGAPVHAIRFLVQRDRLPLRSAQMECVVRPGCGGDGEWERLKVSAIRAAGFEDRSD